MSTAMVSLGIATGFERGYGVLKRLGATPLGRPRLLGAKIATIVVVEVAPGRRAGRRRLRARLESRRPRLGARPVLGAIAAVLLATVAFGGIGLFMAGVLKAEVNLAAANGLYLVLLLARRHGGPHRQAARGVAAVAKVLPADALAGRAARRAGHRSPVPTLSWVVLAVWAVAAPVAAALSFRWE